MSAPFTLFEKQKMFSMNVALLLLWCEDNGYGVTFGEAYRTEAQARLNEQNGVGIANSLHTKRLAIDLNLFKLFKGNKYLTDSASYRTAGYYWRTLNPLNRWGGDFTKPDGNHFSMEHEGVQ